MALNVLEEWAKSQGKPLSESYPEFYALLEGLVESEVREDVKSRMAALL